LAGDSFSAENAYFLASYVSLRHFLSIYDPTVSAAIFVHDNPQLIQFLNELFSDSEKIKVFSVGEIHIRLRSLVSLRNEARRRVREEVPTVKRAYFFCDRYTSGFFPILGELNRRRVKIHFHDAETQFTLDPVPASFRDRIILSGFARIVFGIKLRRVRNQWWPTLQIEGFRNEPISLLSWKIITERFPYRPRGEVPGREDALFIDAPISTYPGIDRELSTKKVGDYLRKHLTPGTRIFVKPHPRHLEISLATTDLMTRIIVVPSHVPAEYWIGYFSDGREIYVITSAAVNAFDTPIRSFANFMCFHDLASKENFEHHRQETQFPRPGLINLEA